MKVTPFRMLIAAVALAALIAAKPAHAVNYTWSGAAVGTWDTSNTNWSGAPANPWDNINGPSNTAVFNTASLNATVSGTVDTNGITFTTGGALSGGTINLAASSTISVNTGQSATIASSITGAGTGLTVTGAGTLTLTGTNSFSGSTLVTGAGHGYYSPTLLLNSSTGPAISGNLTIGNSGAGMALVQTQAVNQFGSSTVITMNGNGGFPAGYSYLDLLGKNQSIAGLVSTGSTPGTTTVQNTENLAGQANSVLTITTAPSTSYNFAGAIRNGFSGTIGITKDGTGTQEFSGTAVNYTGATTVTDGTLKLTNTGGFRSATSIASGKTVELAASSDWVMGNGATFSGTGILKKTGANAVSFGGNDYGTTVSLGSGGLIDIQGGKIKLDFGYNKTSWASNLADMTIAGGATFDLWDYGQTGANFVKIDSLNGAGTINRGITGTTTGGLEIGVDNGTGGNFSGIIQNGVGTSTLSLKKSGTGVQTFSGTNTYTGSTTISGGTLQFAKQVSLYNNTPASWTAANITVNSGTTLALNVGGTGEFTSADLDTIKLIGTATTGFKNGSILGLDTTSGDFSYSTAISNTFAGANAIGLTKLGPNKLTLSGANNYSGPTAVNQGTLQLTNAGGYRSATTVASGATVEVNTASNATLGNVTSFSGSGTFAKTGAAMLLMGGNDYSTTVSMASGGLIDIQAGTIRLDFAYNKSSWSSNLADMTIASSAIFDIWDYGQSSGNFVKIDSLNGSGIIQRITTGTTTGGLEIGVDNGTGGDFSGTIRNSPSPGTSTLGLKKSGTGTQTLSGANTYSGTTAVNGGKLLVNGTNSGAGAFTVANLATLGGTGSIAGAITVSTGGLLSPGASIESLTSGVLTMNSGSTFVFEASNNSSTGADLMKVTGALSLTSVTLDLTGANLSAGSWVVGDKLTLVSYTVGSITSGFTGYADDTLYTFGANNWLFNYNDAFKGNNFSTEAAGTFVTLTMVPEPSSLAMLLFGTMMLWLVGRKRNA